MFLIFYGERNKLVNQLNVQLNQEQLAHVLCLHAVL